ncbi:hypothetical protein Dda_5014 [Drechslerella dactyloides]|uniref:Uncharacterized protein n=1 Tax=Drechslerella dactyloides TaxID=74499 RepID=A0AAD6NJX1_DREDA|nr:hypothetical protein Dda_5014 [Drechslerella dactyloides]
MRPLSTSPSLILLITALSIDATSASPALWTRLRHTVEQWLPQSPLQPNTKNSDATPGSLVTVHMPAVTATTIHATTTTALPLPDPWPIYYPEEEEEEDTDAPADSNQEAQGTNSGHSKRQCANSGLDNSGCNNSGNGNQGDNNSGNYNCGNGNSGNYNSGDGQAGNGGSGACGSVVVGQSVAYVYPAPSTVVVQVAPVTQLVTVQYPQVYTTYMVYVQPPATTVVVQQPQTIAIAAAESYAPRGCAYWEALGYRCSPANGWRGLRAQAAVGMAAVSVFWGILMVIW